MDQAPELISGVVGGRGHITLDRPRTLNALSFEMCRGFDAALEAWARDDRVSAVLIRSASPRAFSTGADVIRIHHARDRLEYRLVRRCLAREDDDEGVRAAVIDKDGAPRWRPASLAEVREAAVEAHFEPLGTGELGFDWDPDL